MAFLLNGPPFFSNEKEHTWQLYKTRDGLVSETAMALYNRGNTVSSAAWEQPSAVVCSKHPLPLTNPFSMQIDTHYAIHIDASIQ